jgi:hypothetical protein
MGREKYINIHRPKKMTIENTRGKQWRQEKIGLLLLKKINSILVIRPNSPMEVDRTKLLLH